MLDKENGLVGALVFLSLLTSDVLTSHRIGARLEPVLHLGLHGTRNCDGIFCHITLLIQLVFTLIKAEQGPKNSLQVK